MNKKSSDKKNKAVEELRENLADLSVAASKEEDEEDKRKVGEMNGNMSSSSSASNEV